jgi:hypothetical protein
MCGLTFILTFQSDLDGERRNGGITSDNQAKDAFRIETVIFQETVGLIVFVEKL